jgi:kynureninase
LVTPLEHEKRGSQVAYAFGDGYAVVQALITAGVVGDFRAPNIMRFGFTPLYLSHQDVLTAVARLREIMHKGTHLEPRFRHKAKVT